MLILFLALVLNTSTARASVLHSTDVRSFAVELEGQVVWQGRNDAAVPGDTGTRFSLKDVLDSPTLEFRIEPTWFISEKHQLRAVFAPFTLNDTGTLSQPVTFQGSTFSSASPVEATYRFNSYRLTYRYAFIQNQRWTLLGGITGKIRDAKISLTQGAVSETKSNVGFVPLLHASLAYRFSPDWQAELELDGLAAPQGRAEDLRLAIRKRFAPTGLSAALGYRALEGGADNDEVYTFSLFHYVTASLAYEF